MVEEIHKLIDWWSGTQVPPKIANFLRDHGSEQIQSLAVARAPISKVLDLAIDIVSAGKYGLIKDRVGFDHMFHLGVIINGRWFLEKNEMFNIRPYSAHPKEEKRDVPVSGDLTIAQFMQRASQGDEVAFYRQYDPFGKNCQAMVLKLLRANGLLTDDLKKFIHQDVSTIANEIPETHKTSKDITDVASLVSRLLQIVSRGRLSLAVGGVVRRRRRFKGYR
jgi:hypothetical protein